MAEQGINDHTPARADRRKDKKECAEMLFNKKKRFKRRSRLERIVKSQDLEYEICVMRGTLTNIPKTQLKGGFKAISEHIGTEIRFTKEQE